jgi:hypothetical protein
LVEPALHVDAGQLAPPTQRLLAQLQSAGQVAPQSSWPWQPSPMVPQYLPPIGVHDTADVQLPVAPPVGTMMSVPEPPEPPCALPPPVLEPAVLVAPPCELLPGGGLALQLAAAMSAKPQSNAGPSHLKKSE